MNNREQIETEMKQEALRISEGDTGKLDLDAFGRIAADICICERVKAMSLERNFEQTRRKEHAGNI